METGKIGSRQTEPPRSAEAAALSRRRFGQLAMLGLAGSTLLPAEWLRAGRAPLGGSLAETQDQQTPGLSRRAQAEVERKLQWIFAEYGDRLSDEQKKRMRGIVANHVRMLEAVRAFPLHNPDPPATVLKLVTGPGDRAPQTSRSAARRKAASHARPTRQEAR